MRQGVLEFICSLNEQERQALESVLKEYHAKGLKDLPKAKNIKPNQAAYCVSSTQEEPVKQKIN